MALRLPSIAYAINGVPTGTLANGQSTTVAVATTANGALLTLSLASTTGVNACVYYLRAPGTIYDGQAVFGTGSTFAAQLLLPVTPTTYSISCAVSDGQNVTTSFVSITAASFGIAGPPGPAGTGTSIATATSIGTTGNVPSFGGSPNIIREDIDMSAASQITRTLPTAANFPNGSIYAAHLVNLGTTAQIQPVIFTGTIPMEDPENPGNLATTVKCALQGDCIWWQRNSATGLQIIARALPAQIPQ